MHEVGGKSKEAICFKDGSAVSRDWPGDSEGQVYELAKRKLHFTGEHTCYAFMGYMEGALSSGYRIARRIAVRDDLFPA
jgi:monoamine oxidase